MASGFRASERLLLRVNRSDVLFHAIPPSTGERASSDWTADHRLLVDRCYVLLHGTERREGLVTSTPAAGDGFALEVHSSDVRISICLPRELRVTQVARKRSLA